jgi:peptidoglycan hydrolase-like protein with peptidoglycan-binding domain
VNAWQKALMANDISLLRFGADSDFGGETETGTKAFQKKHGLKQTGKVDEDTMAMMFVVLISKNADPGKSKKLQGIIDNLHGRLDEIQEIAAY